jgi:hypothetical protein
MACDPKWRSAKGAAGILPADRSVTHHLVMPARCRQNAKQILGLSPRTEAKQSIRRRGATAERPNKTVAKKGQSGPTVSVQNVAGRANLSSSSSSSFSSSEMGQSRTRTRRRTMTIGLQLRRAALYRRFLTCQLPPASNALPVTNRRYGRLKICATLNRYPRAQPAYFEWNRCCCRGRRHSAR